MWTHCGKPQTDQARKNRQQLFHSFSAAFPQLFHSPNNGPALHQETAAQTYSILVSPHQPPPDSLWYDVIMVKQTRIAVAGNSLAVRITREAAERLGWARGQSVLVTVVGTGLVVARFDEAAAHGAAVRALGRRRARGMVGR